MTYVRHGLLPLLLTMMLSLVARPALALDLFETPKVFIAERACEATLSIAGRDPVPIEMGESYVGRGLNRRSGATHVLIRLGGSERWVALGCGRIEDAPVDAGVPGSDSPKGEPRPCRVFFDTEDNPVPVAVGGPADITPPPPALTPFDKAVMATCGPAGKVVSRDEFTSLLRAHPDVLERIRAYTGSRVFAAKPASAGTEAYLADLTEAWFAIKAFDHILCGEPGTGRNSIGGLHFHGRYLQLQQTGEACRMDNFRQNEVVPGAIYTMGVEMRTADGRIARHATKGYGLTLDAEEIIAAVTRAFAENPTTSSQSSACLLDIEDDAKAFKAVFVRRAEGIRTFYPDATPNGDTKFPPAPPCAAPLSLATIDGR